MYKLRELSKKDLPAINKWRNDEHLISFLGAPFRYIDLRVDEEWFENYLKNRSTNIRLSIVNEDDDCIGLVSLMQISTINRSATLHIMIGSENNCGKGVGSFAVKKMLEHAFFNLNLNRVELDALESNARARHVYEKIGFVQEGIKRNAVYKNGKFVNMVMYGVLKEEFETRESQRKTWGGATVD